MLPRDIVLKIRVSTGLTQEKFAALIKMHRSSVSQFETGVRLPHPHHVKKYLTISKKKNLKFTLEDFYN